MKLKIDFNCDMGESFGMYKMGADEQIIPYITSANIACGFHAGDPNWMNQTVKLAEKNNVGIGAHPSFPDLKGFGRRNMNVSNEEVKNDLKYQMGALTAFTKDKKLQHVKPHGAMYNQSVEDENLSRAICEAILEFDENIILIALANSKWIKIAKEMGLKVAREIFADRALNPDGSLVSRSITGSVIHDTRTVINRSIKMIKNGSATTIEGKEISVEADSICLHSDTPGSIEMAKLLHSELGQNGIEIQKITSLI
tara:strand:+ start:4583 stop:5347 length:765 start_codon:yes stop_codon:yes gene_type:complete